LHRKAPEPARKKKTEHLANCQTCKISLSKTIEDTDNNAF